MHATCSVQVIMINFVNLILCLFEEEYKLSNLHCMVLSSILFCYLLCATIIFSSLFRNNLCPCSRLRKRKCFTCAGKRHL